MHEERDTLWHFVMSIVKYRKSHSVTVLDIYGQRMKDLLLRARAVVRTSNMKTLRCLLADYVKTLHQKRAARLFFFIQPIKWLIFGVVVDVAVVKS